MILSLLLRAGPIKVAVLGPAKAAANLASMLGPAYQVDVYPSIPQLPELIKYHPDYVVTGVQGTVAPEGLDTFVPDLERRIAELKGLPGHPKVLLRMPTALTDFDSTALRPLVAQAARETDTQSFDSDTEDDARQIFFAIYDWKQAKAGWKVLSVDSQESDEGPASNAIDGDPETYWHTRYSPTTAKYPHEIVIDMGVSKLIGGIRYLPRQDGGTNGRIKDYEVWTADQTSDKFLQATTGSFHNSQTPTYVYFKQAVRARFVKFRALSEQTGQPYASIAELDVLPAKLASND